MLDTALPKPDDWQTHQRVSYVRMAKSWVPCALPSCSALRRKLTSPDPFQNNIAQLPMELQLDCLDGLITAAEIRHKQPEVKPTNFDEWIVRNMGEGIADLFMRPYNFKVWGVPPHQVRRYMSSQQCRTPADAEQMQCKWLGERVAAPSLRTVVKNAVTKESAPNWGPNATFRFPTHGGTGGIWTAVADMIPAPNMRMGAKAVVDRVDPVKKEVQFTTGRTVRYQHLVSTMALDGLLQRLEVPNERLAPLQKAAEGLVYSSTIVLGVGVRGERPSRIGDKCKPPLSHPFSYPTDGVGWLYFPEDNTPFYRATIFSNYSEFNVPSSSTELRTTRRAESGESFDDSERGGPYWSIMFEVCQSEQRHVDLENLLEETIKGAVATELLRPEDEIVSTYQRRFDHG